MMEKANPPTPNEGFALARIIETVYEFADQFCVSNSETREELIHALAQAQVASLRWGMEIAISQGGAFSDLIENLVDEE